MLTNKRLALLVAFSLVVLLAPVAVNAAGGPFTDDDNSLFEADIEWPSGAGVTAGCNPPTSDRFCPDDNVKRRQMAAFMRRFAQFLGAEDGVVDEADHAARAASADDLAGRTPHDFQPAVFDSDATEILIVNSGGTHTVASAQVTTREGGLCRVGQSPKADILVRASGFTEDVGSIESADLDLTANGSVIDGTHRRVTGADGSFAMEWLFVGNGGIEKFTLAVNEAIFSPDRYTIRDAHITVEVLQDTRCEGLRVLP